MQCSQLIQLLVLVSSLLTFYFYTNFTAQPIDAGLSPTQVKSFYDWFGAWQDYNHFYELKPILRMLELIQVERAKTIFEFGCGTGSLAERILNQTKDVKYIGADISDTMVQLTKKRLNRFGERVKVVQVDGTRELPKVNADIFLSTYVFDAISNENIEKILKQAHEILRSSKGKIGLVNLTKGEGFFAKAMTTMWEKLYQWNPKLLGGCRPVKMKDFILKNSKWKILHSEKMTSLGLITSEILVAQAM